jgi:hypothetical protein
MRIGKIELEFFSLSDNDVRLISISLVLLLHAALFNLFISYKDKRVIPPQVKVNSSLVVRVISASANSNLNNRPVQDHFSQAAIQQNGTNVVKPSEAKKTDVDESTSIVTSKGVTASDSDDGEKYFVFEELDVPAEPVDDFDFPEIAKNTVIVNANVEIFIDRFGRVQLVNILTTDNDLYSEVLRRVIAETQFTPALKAGSNVNSIKVIELAVMF